MTRGESRKRPQRGYSAAATLGVLVGLLVLPFAMRVLPLEPPTTATPLPYQALRGHTGWVNCVDYSPSGRYVATGSDDGTAILWDAATGQRLVTLRGHSDAVDPVLFCDERYLATASLDGTARLWTVPNGECVAIMAGDGEPIYAMAVVPLPEVCGVDLGGTNLVTGGADGHLQVWRVPQGDRVPDVSAWTAQWTGIDVVDLAVGRDQGEPAITANYEGEAPQTVRSDPVGWFEGVGLIEAKPTSEKFPRGCRIEPTDSAVTAICEGGRYPVAGCADGSVHLLGFDATCIPTPDADDHILLRGHGGRVESIASHGDRLATAAQDNTVRVWDIPTRRCLAVLRTAGPGIHADWIERHSVAFSPDGQQLATAQGFIARIHQLPE